MALNFLRKKKKEEAEPKKDDSSNLLLAMPLFNNNETYEIQKIIDHLKNFWELNVTETEGIDNETAVFNINDQMVAIAMMPAPVPKEELEAIAPYNYTWRTALNDLKNHTGHCIVSILNSDQPAVERYTILSKIICSIMSTSNCVGVYQGMQTLLLSKNYYLEFIEDLKDGAVCIPLWVYIGIRQEDNNNISLYTYGMDCFDKNEIEIINSQKDVEELYNFMLNITSYIIGNNVILQDGETIGYTATHKVPIKLSKGVYLEGQTLKIEL